MSLATVRGALARKWDRAALDRATVLAARYAERGSGEFGDQLVRWLTPGSPLLAHQEVRDAVASAADAMSWSGSDTDLPDATRRRQIVDQFHRLYYYDSWRTWRQTTYRGLPIPKCPLDLWVYMELIAKVQPDLVVETGTGDGGTAYLLGDLCEAIGKGQVVTVEIEDRSDWPAHAHVKYLHGAPLDPVVVRKVAALRPPNGTVLVILASAHSAEHVRQELEIYAPMVTVGSYLIVEKTNIHGHPVRPNLPDGPMEAVRQFLAGTDEFEIDAEQEKFMLTFNPSGYLKRVKQA